VASPPIPFASWTPTELWLGCELARRGLVARLDGGLPRPAALAEAAAPGDPFVVEHVTDAGEVSLRLILRAGHASVALDPALVDGNRWRRDWVIELWRSPDERWVLGPGEPPAEIPGALREPVQGRLLTRRRFLLLRGEDSAFRVRLEDRAFYRNTTQSSARPLPVAGSLAWSAPTLPEPAPWWQIDLGRSYFLPEFSLDLADLPPGAALRVRGCAMLSPAGEPPSPCLEIHPAMTGEPAAITRVEAPLGWVVRYLRFDLCGKDGEPLILAVAGCELPGAELLGGSLRTTWGRALALFRDRVMFAARERDDGPFVPALRFGEVAQQASALARGLAYFLEDSGTDRIFLALATRSRPEWIMADLAAIERGYVVVPLSPDEPEDRLASILARCRPAAMLVEQADVARLAALASCVCPSLTLLVVCGAPGGEASPGGASPTVSASNEEGQEAGHSNENGQDDGPLQVRFEDLVWQGQTRGATPPPAPRTEEDLYSLLFTSGSTGEPKGAMRSYAAFHAMLATYGVPQPAFHLSFQPLSHLSERMYLPAVLLHGGTVAFSRGGTFLLDELRDFAPSVLGSVPRLFDLLHAKYQRRLGAGRPEDAAATEEAATREARLAFGHRLLALSVGSAPVSPEVLAFLRRVFADIWVTEGYGTTEVGTIAGNGQIHPRVKVKLVPLPGEPTASGAGPLRGEPAAAGEGPARGEIWVHSPHTISGYFGDPEASAAALDAEGFFRTGDLGERLADGTIRVIGRLASTVKLAQGEFVSAERIEAALSTAPVVDRIFVLAEPGAAGVAALVFPEREALARLLDAGDEPLADLVRHPKASATVLAALGQHGILAGLAAYEMPRVVVLDATPPSVAGGLLTASGKLARAALAARLSARLRDSSRLGADAAACARPPSPQAARLAEVASSVLGRKVHPDEPLAASLDSLSAAALLASLTEEIGFSLPLPDWFASSSLTDLAARLYPPGLLRPSLDRGGRFLPASALASAANRDLAEPIVFGPWTDRPTGSSYPSTDHPTGSPHPSTDRPTHHAGSTHPSADRKSIPLDSIFLTGATGFLGVHLVESLLARTSLEVVCLVRASDEAKGAERLAAVMDCHGVEGSPRVHVVAGDLAAPRLGLTEAAFAALAGRVDAVLHAGAEVSWLAPYAALRGPNVEGTRTVLQLAAHGRPRPMHLVSTISTTPPDGDESSRLSLEQALGGSPYALSKWVAEDLARRATYAGLPVTTYRPAMIAPHSRRGIPNPKDFLHRYLTGCIALGLYLDLPDHCLDMTPVDFVADAIVALLMAAPFATETYHLANIDQSLSYTQIGRALRAAGARVSPADYATFRAALVASRGQQGESLRALASFFPVDGFSLGMGPWDCSRTLHRLTRLGVHRPAIDASYVRRLIGR
jgi:fatty acid CoA ligase FadD9